jgi:hypothetical protein
MLATTDGEFSSTQVYTLVTLPQKGFLEYKGTVLSVGDTFGQKELSKGALKYLNTQDTAFSDEFIVDVMNAAKGWLPDNKVSIREATLSINSNRLQGVYFWPNPVKNIFNVKITNPDAEKVFISLFDLQGRKILQVSEASNSATFTKEINLRNISSGIYLLSVQQGKKKSINKIIVSN